MYWLTHSQLSSISSMRFARLHSKDFNIKKEIEFELFYQIKKHAFDSRVVAFSRIGLGRNFALLIIIKALFVAILFKII